ncbi:methyltransferase, FxLD system [Streptomyces violascens]|uniref:methyltransferase, FxLD system n=1 Tax=Streptomyces violascens TaxID=67381 RepID=UPI0037AEF2EF
MNPTLPDETSRLRQALVDQLVAEGWIRDPVIEDAFRRVPRHRFMPEAPLEAAYRDAQVITKRDACGSSISAVSAPWLQAHMLAEAALRPGQTVIEIGSGGCNAAYAAELVGPRGRIVTVDIDPFVTDRATQFLADTGYTGVSVVLGDGGLEIREVPEGGADAIIVTVEAQDIPPAWIDQLAEGGRLVVPLRIHGYTWVIGFEKQRGLVVSRSFRVCQFVPMQGSGARNDITMELRGGEIRIRFADGQPADTSGLEEALRMPRHEQWTGITIPGASSADTLLLWLATTLGGFCRLGVDPDSDTGLVDRSDGWDAAAIVRDSSLAYLLSRNIHTDSSRATTWEFGVHAFGPRAASLAQTMAQQIVSWDRNLRSSDGPLIAVHAAKDVGRVPLAGRVLAKPHARLVFDWAPGPACARDGDSRSGQHQPAPLKQEGDSAKERSCHNSGGWQGYCGLTTRFTDAVGGSCFRCSAMRSTPPLAGRPGTSRRCP